MSDVDERLRQLASIRGYYVPAHVWGDPAAVGLPGNLVTYEDILALGNPAQAKQSAWAASVLAENSDWTRDALSNPDIDGLSTSVVRNSIGNRYFDDNREERALKKRERYIDMELRKLQAGDAPGNLTGPYLSIQSAPAISSQQSTASIVTIASKTQIQEELAKASILVIHKMKKKKHEFSAHSLCMPPYKLRFRTKNWCLLFQLLRVRTSML